MSEYEDDDEDFPEQFSQATREAMIAAVEALVGGLRAHASFVSGLRGGSSDLQSLFAAHAEVEGLLDTWNDRVFDHTGTFPVCLVGSDDHDDDDEEDDEEDDEQGPQDGAPLSVVSRWDLRLVDGQALLQAGRQAHQRLQPEENDQDAEAAVPDPGQALYALLHEAGEPWYDLPGIEVLGGARVFVEPDGPAPLPDEGDFESSIVQPPGRRLYGETWT